MPRPRTVDHRAHYLTVEVTAAELGHVLGLSHQTVSKLRNDRVISQQDSGRYVLAEAVQDYIANATGNDEAETARLKIEKDRADLAHKQAQAEFQERKNAVFAGQYIARADVETALSPVISDFTEHLRTGFEREFPAWAVGKSASAIKAECQARIDTALARVRDGCSAALDTAESKATGGMASDEQGEQPEVLKPGRPREPNSRRSKRARRHATEGKPASGRKPKPKKK